MNEADFGKYLFEVYRNFENMPADNIDQELQRASCMAVVKEIIDEFNLRLVENKIGKKGDARMKLYLITLSNYKSFYVLATDETAAYYKLRKQLDELDWYFENGRDLRTIEVLAKSSIIENVNDIFEKEN